MPRRRPPEQQHRSRAGASTKDNFGRETVLLERTNFEVGQPQQSVLQTRFKRQTSRGSIVKDNLLRVRGAQQLGSGAALQPQSEEPMSYPMSITGAAPQPQS